MNKIRCALASLNNFISKEVGYRYMVFNHIHDFESYSVDYQTWDVTLYLAAKNFIVYG